MDEALRILAELRQLLDRYGHDERAGFLEQVIDARHAEDFWATLSGLEFWGGAGAVWEIEPFTFSHPDSATWAADYRRFQTLMVDLAAVLEARDMGHLASRNADLFRRHLKDRDSG